MTSAPSAPAIRAAVAADAAALAALYRPYVELGRASFEEVAPDAAEMARRVLAEPRLPWLVAELDGQVVGYAYASPHGSRPAYRWTCDCSVYVGPAATGHGVGSALYVRLLPVLADLGYTTAMAAIVLPNDASIRLHTRFGFHLAGTFRRVGWKHGQWCDVAWYQRVLAEAVGSPRDPRPWQPG